MRNLRASLPLAAAGLALAAALVGASPMARAEERRIATLAPKGSTWMNILERGGAEIEKLTSGRITTKYYPNGVQGDERDVIRKMRLGQLDGAAVTSVGLALIDESIRVLELPRMFASTEELDYVRDKMWPYFRQKFAQKGFILAATADVGWIYIYSNTAVKSVADLKQTKMWIWVDDRIAKEFFQALGVSGVPLGVPDVLPSLTSGRINAVYNSPLGAVALQWNTQVKYVTSVPFTYSIASTVMRKDIWDQTSDQDRELLKKVYIKQAAKLRDAVRSDNETARKQTQRKGVKTIETPPELVRALDKAAEDVWKSLVGKVYTQEELDMVLKHRAEYRAKAGK